MNAGDIETLWLSYFDVRSELDIAARHALDDETLTTEDLACFDQLRDLAEQGRRLALRSLTERERVGLAQLQAHLDASCGRAQSYLLATSRP